MKAKFRVLDGTEVIRSYELEYTTTKGLNDLFHEARQVWDEYMIEVETEIGILSYSHTYAEEVKRGWV